MSGCGSYVGVNASDYKEISPWLTSHLRPTLHEKRININRLPSESQVKQFWWRLWSRIFESGHGVAAPGICGAGQLPQPFGRFLWSGSRGAETSGWEHEGWRTGHGKVLHWIRGVNGRNKLSQKWSFKSEPVWKVSGIDSMLLNLIPGWDRRLVLKKRRPFWT